MRRFPVVNARILVASSDAGDAELVANLLRGDFEGIRTTVEPDRAVEDFEQLAPQVLVLAFKDLEEAKQFYLGLYRLSGRVHAIPHRTVVLCNRSACRQAYELCYTQRFDDYIEFWPATRDPLRLAMSVLLAVRAVEAEVSRGPSPLEMARQAHRILELETKLREQSAAGSQRAEAASESLSTAESDMREAVAGLSRQILADPGFAQTHQGRQLAAGLQRLGTEGVRTPLRNVEASIGSVRQWFESFSGDIAPRFAPVRTIANAARGLKPLVLVVDDDPFQHQLLRRMLDDLPLNLEFASSGKEALAILRSRGPDLVLMDVALPDIDGVEVVRRIRDVPALASTPAIFMTGHSTKSVVTESLDVGAADFMAKPFTRARVIASISRLLGPAVDLTGG